MCIWLSFQTEGAPNHNRFYSTSPTKSQSSYCLITRGIEIRYWGNSTINVLTPNHYIRSSNLATLYPHEVENYCRWMWCRRKFDLRKFDL